MGNAAMQHLHGNMPNFQAAARNQRDDAGESVQIAQSL
jgi:hypothetical protein